MDVCLGAGRSEQRGFVALCYHYPSVVFCLVTTREGIHTHVHREGEKEEKPEIYPHFRQRKVIGLGRFTSVG